MADTTELIERHSERAKVESWRLHVLIEAGYPLPLAEKIAAALDADLHEAVAAGRTRAATPASPPRFSFSLVESRPDRDEHGAERRQLPSPRTNDAFEPNASISVPPSAIPTENPAKTAVVIQANASAAVPRAATASTSP